MKPQEPPLAPDADMDYRFTLANERTFLAWIRTALVLVAGGIAAAKGLDFHHEVWRWVIATPPIVAGLLLALKARSRWQTYEQAMKVGAPLPAEQTLTRVALAVGAYAFVALLAAALDIA